MNGNEPEPAPAERTGPQPQDPAARDTPQKIAVAPPPAATEASSSRWTWTAPQRRVLLVLLSGFALFLALRLVKNRSYVSDPQPARPSRYDELADRIDPNAADWQTLSALPGIGEKRAKEIVAYREDFARRNPDRPAFTQAEDLLRMRGIGSATVENLRPYLYFPPPTSGPAP